MVLFTSSHLRFTTGLLITALLVSGCSSSSDSSTSMNGQADDSGESNVIGISNEISETGQASTADAGSTGSESHSVESIPNVQETNLLAQNTTLVNFDITVPVYVSDALQIRMVWGDQDITASWVAGEAWAISADFPANTENQLLVTFNDENGAITLGSFESEYSTGTNVSESFQIGAEQFDTAKWDNDGDGVSNLDELIAGTNPGGGEVLQAVQASLELVADKTFRISWQPSSGADFYRVFENPDGLSGFTQISGDIEPSSQVFDHRVPLYTRFNASYLVQTCSASGCIDSDEQRVSGTLEQAIGYFKASNPDLSDTFGWTTSLSGDGSTLVVGAPREGSGAIGVNGNQSDNSSNESGAVYVLERANGIWKQQAYLKASNNNAGDYFGYTVSLSANGNTLAVGAPYEGSAATGVSGNQNDNSVTNTGAAYVFERANGIWQQKAYLKPSDTDTEDSFGTYFGSTVSLSADGSTLAIGATGEDSSATGVNGNEADNSADSSGAAYIFERSDESWEQRAFLKASNTEGGDGNSSILGDRFGHVSISANGNTLAVGAIKEDSAATGVNGDQNDNSVENSGALYVFDRVNGSWEQTAYIKAGNTKAFDEFGGAISISADGNTIAVGAYKDDGAARGVNGNQNDSFSRNQSGAVYVFQRLDSIWQQQAYIKASNSREDDEFGFAVAISADGNTLAVGAKGEDSAATGVNGNQSDIFSTQSGAVYVFEQGSGNWQQKAYLKQSNAGSLFGRSAFGLDVSISADGRTIVVGATGDSSLVMGVNGVQADAFSDRRRSGAVYLF